MKCGLGNTGGGVATFEIVNRYQSTVIGGPATTNPQKQQVPKHELTGFAFVNSVTGMQRESERYTPICTYLDREMHWALTRKSREQKLTTASLRSPLSTSLKIIWSEKCRADVL